MSNLARILFRLYSNGTHRLPIETSGQSETPSTTLVDLANFEIPTISATVISAAQVFTSALPNSSNTTVVAPSITSGNIIPPTVLPVAKASVVVVKQLEQVKPYNGSSSHRAYRDYFERICKVNNWETNAEKAQHLSVALHGPAVELLKEISENQPDATEQMWAAFAHRFGYLDEPERAMQRFDNRHQGGQWRERNTGGL